MEDIESSHNRLPVCFKFIAWNTLIYTPPLVFFGNIVVVFSGDNPSTFDIKESLKKPIVNFTRLYALKNNV